MRQETLIQKNDSCLESFFCICYPAVSLFTWSNKAVKVASYEVTHHKAGIEHCNLGNVFTSIGEGHCKIVEGIGQTVGEATVYEERHTKEQRQQLALACKGYDGCHNETTANGEQTGAHGANGQTALENGLGRGAKIERGAAEQQSHKQTACDVTKKNPQQLPNGLEPT